MVKNPPANAVVDLTCGARRSFRKEMETCSSKSYLGKSNGQKSLEGVATVHGVAKRVSHNLATK